MLVKGLGRARSRADDRQRYDPAHAPPPWTGQPRVKLALIAVLGAMAVGYMVVLVMGVRRARRASPAELGAGDRWGKHTSICIGANL